MAVLLSEAWTGANDAPWNSTRWTGNRTLTGSNGGSVIFGNAGDQYVNSGLQTISANGLTVTDFDLTVSYQFLTTASTIRSAEIAYRVGNNATSGTPFNYYLMSVHHDGIYLEKVASGPTYTEIASVSRSFSDTNVRWIRILVEGASHKIKVWADGDDEPGTWDIESTDATYSSGALNLQTFFNNAANDVLWDDLTVSDPPSGATTGTGAPTLARHAGAGSGASTASGTTGSGTPTLSRHTATGTGSTGTTGAATSTLARHIGAGLGATTGIVGSATSTLTRHATAAAGSTGTTGAVAATLTGRSAAGAGSTTAPGGTGTGTPTLTRHTATGTGSTGTTGAGAPACTRHTALGSGSTGLSGSAGVTLIRSTVAGSGTCTQPGATGSGTPTLAPRTGGGTGSTGTTGTGTLLLERHTATGGTQAHSYATAHATHRIPAERRTLEILTEDRSTIIPAERRTLEITYGI